jgi:cobalamin biosynthesis protein CobT
MIHSLASHRLLKEAFMGEDDTPNDKDHHADEDEEADQDDADVEDDDDEAGMELDDDAESLVDSHAAEQAETPELTREQHRDRFEKFDVVVAAAAIASSTSSERFASVDHWRYRITTQLKCRSWLSWHLDRFQLRRNISLHDASYW